VTLSDGVNADVTVTATVAGGVWTAADADISGLDNGNISITAARCVFARPWGPRPAARAPVSEAEFAVLDAKKREPHRRSRGDALTLAP
jgi:hypothetical protein